MRRYGAFEVKRQSYQENLKELTPSQMEGASIRDGQILKNGRAIGVQVEGRNLVGFASPSRKQEFYSRTMVEWGYPDQAIPGYIKSHVHPDNLKEAENEFVLLPTFRLPTHIHSRSANAKWLTEIAHRNPVWIHTRDAARLGVATGELIKVETEIGYFVDKVWVTESIKPGIVACSHHIGRWRRIQDEGNRWMTNTVQISNPEPGIWKMQTLQSVEPFESEDPDSGRVFWRDGGVHQNLTHAVQPDPISGAHCWLQKVRLSRPGPGEEYGGILVDTNKSFEVVQRWNAMARKRETHPDGLRRPRHFCRPLYPQEKAWYLTP